MLAALAGADRPAVDVSKRSVGDGLASALAGPAAKADPFVVSFRGCRLAAAGVAAICGALEAGCSRLESLDLSDNRLRSRAATDALARLVAAEASTPAGTLLTLRLANCALSSRAGAALMAAWKDRDGALRLSELDLSRNALGNAVARDLGDALDGGSLVTLKTLRLAWTGLGGEGAAALASGLGGSNVATCDLGWNALRTDDSNGGAPVAARTPNLQHDFNARRRALRKILKNEALLHLDLRYNQLAGDDLRAIEAAVQGNAALARALAGLHLEGNDFRTFDGPFLAPPPPAVVGDARVYTRVLGTKHVPQSPDWQCGLACWICDRWRETKFVWAPGRSDVELDGGAKARDAAASNRLAVQVRCAFDGWARVPCGRAGAKYECWRLAPPGDRQYCFALGDQDFPHQNAAYDQDKEVASRSAPTVIGRRLADEGDPPCRVVNRRLVPPCVEIKYSTRLQCAAARRRRRRLQAPPAGQEGQGQGGLDLAPVHVRALPRGRLRRLELDWARESRAALRRRRGGGRVQEACREHYSWFRTMFRDYCAQSKALFTLGWNDFTEYVDDCGVMKSGNLRKAQGSTRVIQRRFNVSKADNDMVFFGACTTGPKGPLNPKKSLCRFQFLEAAGRIAFARWLKPGEVPDAAAAIAKLAERMSYLVKPDDEPDAFHDRVWLEEVEDGAKKHLEGLRRAFKAHSGREDQLSKDKRMCFAEWLEFCEAVDLVDADAGFTERDANVAFLRATKTATDELASDAWRRLDFPRFVEALLRVGDRTVDDDVDETPPESCIDLFGRVADAFPSAAEKRRRAALAAERGEHARRRRRRPTRRGGQAAEEGEPRRRGRVRPRREEGREALAPARAKREPEGEDAAPKESAAASLLAAMGRRPSKGGGSGAPRSSVPMAS
ncbi:hypothetical protein JL722_9878 [Aureococcus anophagefferens]|nr:hypothetical protein JL722_9878 [Aureococcus anophagefferens]